MFFSFGEFDRHPEIINQKLSDTDNPPPLEELLIEDGIIEELQNKNEKLIKYLTKEKVKQMIDYIIKEPKEEDHNKGHKFPFVCSKLFNVEETKIMKYFFKTNKELLNEKDDNDNFIKKNINKDIFYDLNPDDKVNIDEGYDNFKEKEINIDDINFNDKKDENNEDNEDVVINDVINLDNNNNNNNYENEDEDMVNLDNENNNEESKNDDNNKSDEKDKKEIINIDKKETDDKNNEICLIKTPDTINNNSTKNNRYDISSTQTPEKKEEKEEEKKEDNKVNNESNKKDDNKKVDEEIKYPEDNIEILDYFFSFLIDDSELNYVLCGYFSSLMTTLFNINYISIVKYLFTKRKDILKRFVYHSYRKSIAEVICKIIKYEDKFNEEINDNKNDYDQKEFSIIRMEIIKDIFEKIEINMETEKLYSISFIINDLIENKKIFDLMVNNKSIINSLINKQLNDINLIKKENEKDEIIFNNKKNNFIIIIDIIINWLNNINIHDMQMPMLLYEVNDDFDDNDDFVQQGNNDNTTPELHHTTLSQALFDILPNLIKTNFNKINNNDNNEENFMIQSYNDYKLKPLGLYRIKIVDLLTSLITYCKNIPNEFDNLLINSNFFENAFNYIFEYQWNNLYQESFFQLLKTLLSYNKDYPYHELAADHLFSKMIILNTIMTSLNNINKDNAHENENENEGNTGKGYTAFLVSLSYKINALIGGNYVNLNKSYTKERSMTFRHKGEMGKNNAMDLFYNLNNININNKYDKNEQDKEGIKPINYIQKYCNEEWNNFFSNNIVNKIKIYEEKLCQSNNNNDDDLFMNSFDNDVDINNNVNKNKDEELFDDNVNINSNSNNNNKYEEDDDIVNNDINEINVNNNNKNVNKNLQNTDMEINLNDFLFVDDTENKNKNKDKDDNINDKCNNDNTNDNDNDNNNKNINKENEEKNSIDNTYNSVNFWKQTLEKENNSYINNLGEEALNELSE